MTPYISNGNKKVKALIFNLPCWETCKPGLACREYCYDKKSERMYKPVKPCRKRNLKQSKQVSFVDRVVDIVKRRRLKIFRIHSGGDFYSPKYVAKWYEIARKLPDVRFYAYTKRDDVFDADLLADRPSNLTLIYSIDGIQTRTDFTAPKGYDAVAITHKTKNNCPAISKKKICMVDCCKCLNKRTKKIIFKKH